MLESFAFRSLRSKMLAVFLAMGLVPMAVVGIMEYNKSRATLVASAKAQLEASAEGMIDKIDRNLFERYGDVQAFAGNPLARGTTAQKTDAANFYTRTYGIYDLMILTDRTGRITAVNTVDPTGKPVNTASLVGRSVADAPWFEAIASGRLRTGETYIEDAHVDAMVKESVGGSGAVVTFSAPIRDAKGQVVGAWANQASIERIVGEIVRADAAELARMGSATVRASVITRDGLLVATDSGGGELTRNLLKDGWQSAALIAEKKSGSIEEAEPGTGEPHLTAYASSTGALGFAGMPWGVLLTQDHDEAVAAAISLRNSALLIAAVASLLIIFSALAFARTITAPIQSWGRWPSRSTASSRSSTSWRAGCAPRRPRSRGRHASWPRSRTTSRPPRSRRRRASRRPRPRWRRSPPR